MQHFKHFLGFNFTNLSLTRRIPFFWAWTILYGLFLLLGAFWPHTPIVSFCKIAIVLLCLIYVLRFYRSEPLLCFAFGFTAVADCILAVNQHSPTGIFVFCFAQISHLFRLAPSQKFANAYLISATALLAVSLFLPSPANLLCCGAIYAATLLANLFLACRWRDQQTARHDLHAFLAAAGFAFFLACDCCVLCSFLASADILTATTQSFFDYFAWVFYPFALICLANSPRYSAPYLSAEAKIREAEIVPKKAKSSTKKSHSTSKKSQK